MRDASSLINTGTSFRVLDGAASVSCRRFCQLAFHQSAGAVFSTESSSTLKASSTATGGSVTRVKLMSSVTMLLVPPSPSVSTKRTVRVAPDGSPETFS